MLSGDPRALTGAQLATSLVSVALDGAAVMGAMAYSRAHEVEAAAGIDPAGMIGVFDARPNGSTVPAFVRDLSSHPPSAERAQALRELAGAGSQAFTPGLDDVAWAAVTRMCAGARVYDTSSTAPDSR